MDEDIKNIKKCLECIFPECNERSKKCWRYYLPKNVKEREYQKKEK